MEVSCRGYSIQSHPATILFEAAKSCGCPPCAATTFLSVIRPILEYAAPVWLEAIQRRALNIIFTCTCGMPYSSALFLAGLTSLTAHREQLAHNFFDSTVQQTSCLHHLLPPPWDPALLSCLRAPSKFPRISNRTKKYQSFISYGLSKYQTC